MYSSKMILFSFLHPPSPSPSSSYFHLLKFHSTSLTFPLPSSSRPRLFLFTSKPHCFYNPYDWRTWGLVRACISPSRYLYISDVTFEHFEQFTSRAAEFITGDFFGLHWIMGGWGGWGTGFRTLGSWRREMSGRNHPTSMMFGSDLFFSFIWRVWNLCCSFRSLLCSDRWMFRAGWRFWRSRGRNSSAFAVLTRREVEGFVSSSSHSESVVCPRDALLSWEAGGFWFFFFSLNRGVGGVWDR